MGKVLCCSMLLFAVACAAAEVSDNPEDLAGAVRRSGGEPRQLTPREQKFQSLLDGATLVGSFTDSAQDPPTAGAQAPAGTPDGKAVTQRNESAAGATGPAALNPEQYRLLRVAPLKNDYWLFQAQIRYGEHQVTLPLTLRVIWAGETPVITVDDLPVPGLGTYSARVMFHEGRYAGTWQGADHGGHLFGRIIAPEAKEDGSQVSGPPRD